MVNAEKKADRPSEDRKVLQTHLENGSKVTIILFVELHEH